MGLLDKMKNLFTEEVDEPVKKEKKSKKDESIKKEILKEEKTVEIAPARKETADFYEKEIEEIQEIKQEEKPEKAISSLYFDDEDFLDLPKKEEPKEVKRSSFTRDIYSEINKENPKFDKKFETKKTENKKFKPSPIISPVYGILDKNYKKDEIPAKVTVNPYKSDKITVDDVRNKAFGTLEDELENTLTSSIVINNEVVEDSGINIFDELETREEKNKTNNISDELEKQKQQIEEINEIIKTNVSPENKKITSRKIDNILEELDEIEELIPTKDKKEKIEETKIEEPMEEKEDLFNEMENEVSEDIANEAKEANDDLEEGDLFNLIDSMYEKRDDE